MNIKDEIFFYLDLDFEVNVGGVFYLCYIDIVCLNLIGFEIYNNY